MRTGNAEEARLKKLYQEADNERKQLRERVCWLESEDEIQCKRSHELQVQNAELKQQLHKLQQEYGIAVKAAVTWEVRFDRLLSVVSGQTTDAAKWGAAIEKIRKWTE